MKDLTLRGMGKLFRCLGSDLTDRQGDQNNTALVSRFCCTLVIENCKVSCFDPDIVIAQRCDFGQVNLENITLAVSEGTLTDHVMELHEASVAMER